MRALLEYQGKQYWVRMEGTTDYIWTDGNYSCDCNKADFIHDQVDESFPEMQCGDSIQLKQLLEEANDGTR